MNKPLLILSLFAVLSGSFSVSAQAQAVAPQARTSVSFRHPDSLIRIANGKSEADSSIPSYSLLRKALVAVRSDSVVNGSDLLADAIDHLQPKETPFSIVVNINEDPSTGMAFTWFTNEGILTGNVQIVKGKKSNPEKNFNPLKSVSSMNASVNDLNYCTTANALSSLAGITDDSKRNYVSHEALVNGLLASCRIRQETINCPDGCPSKCNRQRYYRYHL